MSRSSAIKTNGDPVTGFCLPAPQEFRSYTKGSKDIRKGYTHRRKDVDAGTASSSATNSTPAATRRRPQHLIHERMNQLPSSEPIYLDLSTGQENESRSERIRRRFSGNTADSADTADNRATPRSVPSERNERIATASDSATTEKPWWRRKNVTSYQTKTLNLSHPESQSKNSEQIFYVAAAEDAGSVMTGMSQQELLRKKARNESKKRNRLFGKKKKKKTPIVSLPPGLLDKDDQREASKAFYSSSSMPSSTASPKRQSTRASTKPVESKHLSISEEASSSSKKNNSNDPLWKAQWDEKESDTTAESTFTDSLPTTIQKTPSIETPYSSVPPQWAVMNETEGNSFLEGKGSNHHADDQCSIDEYSFPLLSTDALGGILDSIVHQQRQSEREQRLAPIPETNPRATLAREGASFSATGNTVHTRRADPFADVGRVRFAPTAELSTIVSAYDDEEGSCEKEDEDGDSDLYRSTSYMSYQIDLDSPTSVADILHKASNYQPTPKKRRRKQKSSLSPVRSILRPGKYGDRSGNEMSGLKKAYVRAMSHWKASQILFSYHRKLSYEEDLRQDLTPDREVRSSNDGPKWTPAVAGDDDDEVLRFVDPAGRELSPIREARSGSVSEGNSRSEDWSEHEESETMQRLHFIEAVAAVVIQTGYRRYRATEVVNQLRLQVALDRLQKSYLEDSARNIEDHQPESETFPTGSRDPSDDKESSWHARNDKPMHDVLRSPRYRIGDEEDGRFPISPLTPRELDLARSSSRSPSSGKPDHSYVTNEETTSLRNRAALFDHDSTAREVDSSANDHNLYREDLVDSEPRTSSRNESRTKLLEMLPSRDSSQPEVPKTPMEDTQSRRTLSSSSFLDQRSTSRSVPRSYERVDVGRDFQQPSIPSTQQHSLGSPGRGHKVGSESRDSERVERIRREADVVHRGNGVKPSNMEPRGAFRPLDPTAASKSPVQLSPKPSVGEHVSLSDTRSDRSSSAVDEPRRKSVSEYIHAMENDGDRKVAADKGLDTEDRSVRIGASTRNENESSRDQLASSNSRADWKKSWKSRSFSPGDSTHFATSRKTSHEQQMENSYGSITVQHTLPTPQRKSPKKDDTSVSSRGDAPSSCHEIASEADDMSSILLAEAAVKIQAAFRGFWVRDCINVDHYCAMVIQKAFRGYMCRVNYQYDQYRIVLVQSVWRRSIARSDVAHVLACIIMVQTVVRAFLAKRKRKAKEMDLVFTAQRNDAALRIQCVFRKYWAETYLIRTLVDVLISQSVARGWLAKQKLKRLKAIKATSDENLESSSNIDDWFIPDTEAMEREALESCSDKAPIRPKSHAKEISSGLADDEESKFGVRVDHESSESPQLYVDSNEQNDVAPSSPATSTASSETSIPYAPPSSSSGAVKKDSKNMKTFTEESDEEDEPGPIPAINRLQATRDGRPPIAPVRVKSSRLAEKYEIRLRQAEKVKKDASSNLSRGLTPQGVQIIPPVDMEDTTPRFEFSSECGESVEELSKDWDGSGAATVSTKDETDTAEELETNRFAQAEAKATEKERRSEEAKKYVQTLPPEHPYKDFYMLWASRGLFIPNNAILDRGAEATRQDREEPKTLGEQGQADDFDSLDDGGQTDDSGIRGDEGQTDEFSQSGDAAKKNKSESGTSGDEAKESNFGTSGDKAKKEEISISGDKAKLDQEQETVDKFCGENSEDIAKESVVEIVAGDNGENPAVDCTTDFTAISAENSIVNDKSEANSTNIEENWTRPAINKEHATVQAHVHMSVVLRNDAISPVALPEVGSQASSVIEKQEDTPPGSDQSGEDVSSPKQNLSASLSESVSKSVVVYPEGFRLKCTQRAVPKRSLSSDAKSLDVEEKKENDSFCGSSKTSLDKESSCLLGPSRNAVDNTPAGSGEHSRKEEEERAEPAKAVVEKLFSYDDQFFSAYSLWHEKGLLEWKPVKDESRKSLAE